MKSEAALRSVAVHRPFKDAVQRLACQPYRERLVLSWRVDLDSRIGKIGIWREMRRPNHGDLDFLRTSWRSRWSERFGCEAR